jgi:Uma2 family endonuclease
MRRLSGPEFRSFQETRPDHERWELIEGAAVMMAPPTIVHNRIAGNLERLLNDALATHNPARFANQRVGVELGDAALAGLGDRYRPEPDVVVLDAKYDPGQRFVDCAYLLAEIVSDTDNETVSGMKEPWIAVKRRLYLAHSPCETVIMIEPGRVEVRIDLRTAQGWTFDRLTHLGDKLRIPSCGLECLVGDLYERTPLRGAERDGLPM